MKNIFRIMILLLLLLPGISVFGQQASISGLLIDTLGIPLTSATLVLLHPQDSVMEYFAISDKRGHFEIKNISRGDYIFQASYIGHKSYYTEITVDGMAQDLGLIVLKSADIYLEGATVTAERAPILMNNDTIEYNAGSFRIQANDVVEDLLKKLPGVEVEKDGTIRAQGQEVESITVDGKEFFGNDPTIASQNLPADAVDRVQVFDRKSEVAEFTGVDDGVQSKSINLELKEDKKNGVFGNISAGYGTENRYQAKATVNRFNEKSQISFLGRANNINQQGFSFNDYINFSGGLQNMMAGGSGSLELRIDGNDGPIPFDFGQPNYGFTNTLSGGLNLNHDFSKNTELRSSYFVSQIDKEEDRESFRQNFLGGSTFASEEISRQDSKNRNHRLNINLKQKIDSTQVLRLGTNLNMNDRTFARLTDNKIFNVENILENEGLTEEDSEGNDLRFSSTLSYMLRFKKTGRSLTSTVGLGGDFRTDEDSYQSINQFNQSSSAEAYTDSLHQKRNNKNEQIDYNLGFTYTEPLSGRRSLQIAYNRSNYADESRRNVYDEKAGQSIFNEDLSNEYIRDYQFDRVGFTLFDKRKKANLSIGIQWQTSSLNGEVVTENTSISKTFNAWLPSVNWRYNFSNSKNLRLNYTTELRAPQVEQLQPFVDNSNPLDLYIGNPELKPEYTHRLDLQFVWFDQFTFTNIFANLNSNYTQDKITNTRVIDAQFRQTTQPVNVKDDLGIRANLTFGTPLRFIKSKINIDVEGSYNRSILFLNTVENNANRWNTSWGLSLENRKKKLVDILIGVEWTLNKTTYSVNTDFDQVFSSLNYYSDLNLNFKNNWSVESSLDYTFYQGEAWGSQSAIPIWEASLSKAFLKNKRGTLKVAAVDILNQGIGILQNSNFNYIEDLRINSLGRYFILSFSYALSAFGDQGLGGVEVRSRRR